jgi:hypothetical protein
MVESAAALEKAEEMADSLMLGSMFTTFEPPPLLSLPQAEARAPAASSETRRFKVFSFESEAGFEGRITYTVRRPVD